MHWIIDISDASSISIGRILSPLMWFGHVRDNRRSQILSVNSARLYFFGHLCCADIGQDHSRALRACIRGPPKDWRRRIGRLRQTWLRMVEDDLRPLNFGLATARRRAMDRPAWCLRPRDTLQREREREREYLNTVYRASIRAATT